MLADGQAELAPSSGIELRALWTVPYKGSKGGIGLGALPGLALVEAPGAVKITTAHRLVERPTWPRAVRAGRSLPALHARHIKRARHPKKDT